MPAPDKLETRCVTAQFPIPLWNALDELNRRYPGVAKQALVKAAIALLIESPESLSRYLGKY